MSNQKHLVFFALLVASLLAAGCNPASSESASDGQRNVEKTKPVHLRIAFGAVDDSRARSLSGSIEYSEDLTVLDLLLALAAEKQFQVVYTGRGETAFVTTIDGTRGGNGENGYWIYRVNDQIANQGSGTQVVHPGDKVVWYLGQYPAADQ